MLDYMQFPNGDLDTWSGYSARWTENEERVLCQHLRDSDLAHQLLADGVRVVAPEPRSNHGDRLRLVDTWSGLTFVVDRGDFTACGGCGPDLSFALECRLKLHLKSTFALSRIRDAHRARDRVALVSTALHPFGVQIVDYRADSLEEIRSCLDEIESIASNIPCFRRIWLRGQAEEFVGTRNPEVVGALGLSSEPSLLPSLGRDAREHPEGPDLLSLIARRQRWEKPFLIWVMRQNPQWFHDPAHAAACEASLRDDGAFAFFLRAARYDPLLPTEIDDLRQWFEAYYKNSIWIWVLQQYGSRASMLDITWDLDTALFFTQLGRTDEGRLMLGPPRANRVLYVFAEPKTTQTFWDFARIDWGEEDWNRKPPARIAAQRCGTIIGSTHWRQNLYGHLVVARIVLGEGGETTRRINEVFPPADRDLLFRTLIEARPAPDGLY